MKKRKKIISLLLTFMLIFSVGANSLSFADSGASALPKDDPKATFIFKTFPKSWTSYHTLTTQRKKVSQIRKEGDQLITIGTVGGAVGGVANLGSLSTSLKLAAVLKNGATLAGAGAGACVLTGYGMKVYVKDLKEDIKLVQRVAFKWTDTKKLTYSVRIQCWNEYHGKKISSTKTYYRTGSYR